MRSNDGLLSLPNATGAREDPISFGHVVRPYRPQPLLVALSRIGPATARPEAPGRAGSARGLLRRARRLSPRAVSRHGPRGGYRRERHARLRQRPAVHLQGCPERQVYSDPAASWGHRSALSTRKAETSTATASTPPSAPSPGFRSRGKSRPRGAMNPTTSLRCSTRHALAASRL